MIRHFLLAACVCVAVVRGELAKHDFGGHSRLKVRANKIWPEQQPALSRKYSSLPYCRPSKRIAIDFKHSLVGERLEHVNYDIRFGEDVTRNLCKDAPLEGLKLSKGAVNKFIKAIEDKTHGEIYVDGLPFEFMVGVKQQQSPDAKPQYFLLSHWEFNLVRQREYFLGGNITYPISMQKPQTELFPDTEANVQFKYTVTWSEDNEWDLDRDRIEYHAVLQGQSGGLVLRAHWFAIINTFLLAVLLTSGFGYILIRTVRADVTRYISNHELLLEEEGEEDIDDSGWKQVHGDVFRPPAYPSLFSACVGVGVQVLFVMTGTIVCVLLGLIHPGGDNRGGVYTGILILYTLSSGLAGYVSCRLYTQLTQFSTAGPQPKIRWSQNALLVASVFALPFLLTFAVINSVAIHYDATSALPFLTILYVLLAWAFVVLPITVLGAKFGHVGAVDPGYPCKVTMVARALPPDIPWYHEYGAHMLVGGFLPFTAIFIELHTIFNAIWMHQVYTLFGILAISFVLLYIVTSFATILVTYFQLTTENHRWWWRSLLAGGSAGFFIFAYSVFFYVRRSNLAGALQATMYFGYMGMISYAFFLMLGSMGFLASYRFVRYIYGTVKSD